MPMILTAYSAQSQENSFEIFIFFILNALGMIQFTKACFLPFCYLPLSLFITSPENSCFETHLVLAAREIIAP